jgi:hypothetical protein
LCTERAPLLRVEDTRLDTFELLLLPPPLSCADSFLELTFEETFEPAFDDTAEPFPDATTDPFVEAAADPFVDATEDPFVDAGVDPLTELATEGFFDPT